MIPKTRRACIYCRISEDREGLENGVGTQEADCRALAAKEGYEVRQVYVDNDISASTLSSKPRPEFDAMLAAVRAGEYDVIISLTNGRLTRRPKELETLIELHDKTGVLITTVKSGTDDLSTADGRMVARIKASVDAAEAERTSERVARDVVRRRETGAPHGGPPMFGYVHPTPDNGYKYLQVIDPRARDAILKASVLILNGGSPTDVIKLWAEMKVKRPNGKPWLLPSSVQKTLSAPKIAGYTSKGGVAHARGTWPAIIDRATHEALVEALSVKKPHGKKPRKYLMPGFINCECGTAMVANVTLKYGLDRYLCTKQRGGCGKVSRDRPWVEHAVQEYVRGRLEHEFVGEVDETAPETRQLEDSIQNLQNEIDRLRHSVAAGVFEPEEIALDVISRREQIANLRKEQGKRAKVAKRSTLAPEDTLRVWMSDDIALLSERREIMARYVQRVIVHPLPPGAWGARQSLPRDCITIVGANP